MLTDTIKISDKKSTKMVAHRGVSGLECENTAVAFVAAGNRTYYGVETDIYRTKDNSFICNHDGRTGRICATDLVIEESTFDELRALTLFDKDGIADREEIKLCTPYEYMKICAKYDKVCVPELKSYFTEEEMTRLLEIFEPYLEKTIFISFTIENLDCIKKLRPEQSCQFLTSKWDDSLPEMLAKRGMGLDIHFSGLTEERVKACHNKGVVVNCWTVDDPDIAAQLIGWGVDQITSNILE